MPRKKKSTKKKSTNIDGLRLSKKSRKRNRDDDHWSSDFEDGIEAGFAAAEIASDVLVAILRLF